MTLVILYISIRFFGEAAILVSFFLIVGLAAFFIHDDKERQLPLLLFFIASLLFIAAKVANAPVGILLALFSLSLLFIRKNKISKVIILTGAVSLLIFSFVTLKSTPEWMQKLNNYNTIFYGVLKDSPTPEQDLIDLGIDVKYSTLKDTSGFSGVIDVHGETMSKEVYEKASYIDVLWFYVTHPQRFLDKLKLSAENSAQLKPSYLNNYDKNDDIESLKFTERFSLWENLRKHAVGHAFNIILGYSILYLSIIVISLGLFVQSGNKDYKQLVKILANLVLLCTAAGQFIIPIVGNGEADLQKHMFLFNICFDLMILIGLMWLFNRLNFKRMVQTKWTYGLVVVLLLFVFATNLPFSNSNHDDIQIGDVITFGEYEGKLLEWTVIDSSSDNGHLLWLNEPVTYLPFDQFDEEIAGENHYGSSHWEKSDLRNWLNTEFLKDFSTDDLNNIKRTKLKNVLSHNFVEEKDGGERPFYWTSIPSSVNQNYDQAYFQYTSDLVFTLDVKQFKEYIFDQGLSTVKKDSQTKEKVPYWLRTPYYSTTNMTRMVGKDGFVYHKYSSTDRIGVIPAIYIQTSDE